MESLSVHFDCVAWPSLVEGDPADPPFGSDGSKAGVDRAHLADLRLEARSLDDQPDQVLDPPVPVVEIGVTQGGGGRVQQRPASLGGSVGNGTE